MAGNLKQSSGGNGHSPRGRGGARKPQPAPREAFSPRMAAWHTLLALRRKPGDAAQYLERQFAGRSASDADRRLATHLVMGVLRHRAHIDHCLATLLSKPLEAQRPQLLDILRIGAYQILRLDRVPDYAIVNETVEAVKQSDLRNASGLVNGVLRNCLRRREELAQPVRTGDATRDFEIEHSCPEWLRRTLDDAPIRDRWRDWWVAAQTLPSLHLRVNTLRTTVEELANELREAGCEVTPTPAPDCLAVSGAQRPADLACFREGRATVQDAAATLVGHLLAPRSDERIVDFCAAPGGKTAHIAALTGSRAQILATDASSKRLGKVPDTLNRLGVERVRLEVVTQPLLAQFGSWADAVLVDAPCTGMGTIRRHPEIRWQRTANDVNEAWLRQRTVIHLASGLVRPGGRLVYATCTLFEEENQRVVADFLERHPNFESVNTRETAPDFLKPYLTEDGTLQTARKSPIPIDGFFAAVITRRK